MSTVSPRRACLTDNTSSSTPPFSRLVRPVGTKYMNCAARIVRLAMALPGQTREPQDRELVVHEPERADRTLDPGALRVLLAPRLRAQWLLDAHLPHLPLRHRESLTSRLTWGGVDRRDAGTGE